MAGKGRSNIVDENSKEYTPIDKPEDLPEAHQRRYAKIVDELRAKVLAIYERSRHGGVKIHGVPSSLLDKVDLMTPSQQCTDMFCEEIHRIMAHALIRKSEVVINRMDNIVVKTVTGPS
ncbi:hypothetical protein U9M48_039415 [Paspalum notatum var. saurae]|uniref:Uncharacterized protein n=1 Tax=Paspalum notatum var. saurae TaxID=547442 RepID=A0AAQ3UNX5_PASNO